MSDPMVAAIALHMGISENVLNATLIVAVVVFIVIVTVHFIAAGPKNNDNPSLFDETIFLDLHKWPVGEFISYTEIVENLCGDTHRLNDSLMRLVANKRLQTRIDAKGSRQFMVPTAPRATTQ